MNDTPEGSILERLVREDIGYHLDLSVRLAAAGEVDESASEAVLALALLSIGSEPSGASRLGDLPAPESLVPDGERTASIRRRGHALALEIQAHYASEGRHDLAGAYERAAAWLTAPTAD